MTKLRADLRIAALGSFAGLFTFSIFLLADRVDMYYDYLAHQREMSYEVQVSMSSGLIHGLWWMPFAVWHVLLFVVSGFVVHRYFADLGDSPFLLGQLVGIGALCGWALSVATFVMLDALMRGSFDFERLLSQTDFLYVAKFFASVFAANTACASFLHSAARLYAPGDKMPGSTAPAA